MHGEVPDGENFGKGFPYRDPHCVRVAPRVFLCTCLDPFQFRNIFKKRQFGRVLRDGPRQSGRYSAAPLGLEAKGLNPYPALAGMKLGQRNPRRTDTASQEPGIRRYESSRHRKSRLIYKSYTRLFGFSTNMMHATVQQRERSRCLPHRRTGS